MKYSLLDGAPGSWLFPLFQPATTVQWERNPAVSVTPSTGGSTEIHIVYEREDLVQGVLTWRIYHVYTNNFGAAWIGPVLMNSVARANAYDPAIVCTEDLATPGGGGPGFLNQMVWSEETGFATGVFQILYDAHIYDPTLLPARPYVGPTIIRTNPNVGIIYGCYKPEIASVDERSNAVAYDFPFAIAWEETWPSGAGIPAVRYDIYYVDGTTTTSPGVPATALTAGSIGIISNPLLAQVDAREPDIAASQDYPAPGAVEQYYYHIVWVSKLWPNAGGGAYGNSVEHSYTCGITPWPGFAAFIAGLVPVTGPSVIQAYDNPTVALKLQNVVGPVFDSWFAWEDTSGPSPMDIYYRPGRYTVGGPPFVFRAGPAIVPYAQGNSVFLI